MSKENKPAGTEQDDKEEFVMVEVDDNDRPINGSGAGDDDTDDDLRDEGDVDDNVADETDDETDDEQRLGHSEEDETPEQRRERRKQDRKTKALRFRVAAQAKDRLIENQGRMLLNLQEQVAQLQGRSVQYDVSLLQNTLQQIESQQSDAKAVLAKLSKAGDHEGVAEIVELQMNLRDQHRETVEKLRRAKAGKAPSGEQVDDGAQPRQPARRQQQPNPEVVRRAREWAEANDWSNPATADPEEMGIIRAVDQRMAEEGWNPATAQYWTELTNRVKKRLPHHFKQAKSNGSASNGGRVNNGGKPANGGPKMAPASQSGARSLGKNEVRISKERKEAMQAAGAWDDPVKRNRMLKSYAAYDRANASR